MNFEEALVYELKTIGGLENKVFPLTAPDNEEPPFVVYVSSEGEQTQTLEGYHDLTSVTCEIHVVAGSYESLKGYSKLVIDKLQTFYGRPIGEGGPVIKYLGMGEPVEGKEADKDYNYSSFDIHVRF